MTPACHRRLLRSQVCGWAFSMMRNVSGRTKAIRSRIGSRGRVVTSTMTRPSSRRSVTPPRAPAGAGSAGSVNSTMSPIANSSIVAIPPSVELGISGDQSRRRAFIGVMPCGEDWSASTIECEGDKNAIAGSDSHAAQSGNWRPQHNSCDCLPNEVLVTHSDMKDTPPFLGVPLLAEDPLSQLCPFAPGALTSRKKLSNFRRPRHDPDAKERDRMCVRLRSILHAGNRTEVQRGR
jgi:hypothetical protein